MNMKYVTVSPQSSAYRMVVKQNNCERTCAQNTTLLNIMDLEAFDIHVT